MKKFASRATPSQEHPIDSTAERAPQLSQRIWPGHPRCLSERCRIARRGKIAVGTAKHGGAMLRNPASLAASGAPLPSGCGLFVVLAGVAVPYEGV